MNDTLKLLYDRFYTPLPMEETEQEIDDCHRQLIERLEKPERKLVLRIIDAQNLIAEQRAIGKTRKEVSFTDYRCPESNCRATLRGQFPLRVSIGVGTGI